MDHIVASIHPFVVEQEVSVYKDGECVKTVQCTLDNIKEVCYSLCKEYNIPQLDLCGTNQLYTLHIKEELEVSNKFEDFKINIEVH